MLQDIPTPTLREASSCVLETERLMLRRPTLADVKAIARLANDRRIAENSRRLPHPYSQDHAVAFVRAMADDKPETAFLIENNHTPVGMVGVNWREPEAPELGYWLGVEYWGQGFATEAARAVIDFAFEEFDVRRAGSQSDLAQHSGEMRVPVERRRTASLRGAGLIKPGRSLPPLARHLGLAKELEQFNAAPALSGQIVVPAKAGTTRVVVAATPPLRYR
jgi:RimJ/RimL family protein N-acetyltransferase